MVRAFVLLCLSDHPHLFHLSYCWIRRAGLDILYTLPSSLLNRDTYDSVAIGLFSPARGALQKRTKNKRGAALAFFVAGFWGGKGSVFNIGFALLFLLFVSLRKLEAISHLDFFAIDRLDLLYVR